MGSDGKTDDGYDLSRTYASSARLDYQHYLWKDILGFNLHPHINVQNKTDLKVADVGTGTAIWLLQVSRQLPLASCNGFDISAEQFPPNEWLPANVSLQTLDIFSPIPDELIGQYDIVHVRFLAVIVKNDDPAPILKNLIKMLKPGGYLQWVEYNSDAPRVIPTRVGLKSEALELLMKKAGGNWKNTWVARLPTIFSQHGLTDVQARKYPPSPEHYRLFTNSYLLMYEDMARALATRGPGPEVESLRNLLSAASQEADAGVGLVSTPEVVVGRKDADGSVAEARNGEMG